MKIVCAIDGSRYSEWALDWLRKLSTPDDSSLLLLHAVDMTPFKTLPKLDQQSRSAFVKVLEFSLEGTARLLEGAEVKAAKTWGDVQAKLLRGRPVEVIARSAKRKRADLLVIGSRGVTEFQPMLLGSVSRKVLMQASCPVLVVKKAASRRKRIALGIDGSVEAWEAASWLKQSPETIRPAVTVASVIPPLPLESIRIPSWALAIGDQVEGVLRRSCPETGPQGANRAPLRRSPTFSGRAAPYCGAEPTDRRKATTTGKRELSVSHDWSGDLSSTRCL